MDNTGITPLYFGSDKWAYLNEKGEPLCQNYFKYAEPFSEGFGSVIDFDDKKYFINDKGERVFGIYDDLRPFREGYAVVGIYDNTKGRIQYNYINHDGEFLSERFFDNARPFEHGFGLVFDFDKAYNFIDGDGELLSNKYWFDTTAASMMKSCLSHIGQNNNNNK